jgi:hypothetical protein
MAVLGACLLAPVRAQEDPGTARKEVGDDQSTESARPGPHHLELQKLVGTWKCEIKCWSDADAEPSVTRGEAHYATVLGGRFLREEFDGELHDARVQGIGYLGYNKASGKFESTWMDTMCTGMLRLAGTETVRGKLWRLEGTHAAPDGRVTKTRVNFRQIDADHRVLEMHCDRGEGEFKAMEIAYTRQN